MTAHPHTPAPWSPTLATLVIDLDGNVICRVDPDRPEHEANRALIAAAPEMREALNKLAGIAQFMVETKREGGILSGDDWQTMLEAAEEGFGAVRKSNPDTQ